jgi:type IV secretion system protein VirB9
MQKILILFLIFFSITLESFGNSEDIDAPVAIDSRIKTFVYSENEIFPVVLNYGYQTAIEFSKDETIQTYSVGNQFVWQFSAVGRTLFIKPLEDNIITNMTVLTNKRRYYFELYSKMLSGINDEEFCYVVRFFYPDNSNDSIKTRPQIKIEEKKQDEVAIIKPYNFNYEIVGVGKDQISIVFDNGVNTFMKFEKAKLNAIQSVTCDNKKITSRVLGSYLVINQTCKKTQLNFADKIATINAIK